MPVQSNAPKNHPSPFLRQQNPFSPLSGEIKRGSAKRDVGGTQYEIRPRYGASALRNHLTQNVGQKPPILVILSFNRGIHTA